MGISDAVPGGDVALAASGRWQNGDDNSPPDYSGDAAASGGGGAPRLTGRELLLLLLLRRGYSETQIARFLAVDATSIYLEIDHVVLKVRAADRAGAIAWAVGRGLIV